MAETQNHSVSPVALNHTFHQPSQTLTYSEQKNPAVQATPFHATSSHVQNQTLNRGNPSKTLRIAYSPQTYGLKLRLDYLIS